MQIQNTPVALEPSKIASKATLLVESKDDNKLKSKTAIGENIGQHKQFAVLSRWSELATVSKALAEYEQSERSLRQLYNQLQKLEQQISVKQRQGDHEQLSQKVKQTSSVMSQIATRGNSGIDSQLYPISSTNTVLTRQLPAKVDLLSTRPHGEKIQIMMGRSGKHLTLDLLAGQRPQQNIENLQQAFAPHQIKVTSSDNQQLSFSAKSHHAWPLKEPWVMTGEGVRIAAGNPVSLSLQEPPHALDMLNQLAHDKAALDIYRDEIRQLQRRVGASLQNISQQRQRLQAELRQIQQPQSDNQNMLLMSQSIKQDMRAPHLNSVASVVSQANTTRNLISFSLKSTL